MELGLTGRVAVVPLGRWQTGEDVANMVAFLLWDRAGQVMHCQKPEIYIPFCVSIRAIV